FIEDKDSGGARVKRWRETLSLSNGVSYETLDLVDNGLYDNTPVYQVATGHFFMMGDNPDNSTHRPAPSPVRYLPFENFIGKVQIIFFSIADGEPAWAIWSWPQSVRWNRLFRWVK